MLNRHSQIALCDETYFFYWIYERRRAFGDLADPQHRLRLVEQWLATQRVQRLGLDRAALRNALLREGIGYREFFDAMLREYARQQGKPRHGEKTPDHALYAKLLCEWYPDCRIVHIIRDPRDVVASLGQMPWGGGHTLINGHRWKACVQAAERCRGRENYYALRYEDLVGDPPKTLSALCAFLGVDFQPTMVSADQPAKVDHWWFERAQTSITRDRVGAWRKQLQPRDAALIEWFCGGTMGALGYEPSAPTPHWLRRMLACASAALAQLFCKLANLRTMYAYWLRPTQLAAEERTRRVP